MAYVQYSEHNDQQAQNIPSQWKNTGEVIEAKNPSQSGHNSTVRIKKKTYSEALMSQQSDDTSMDTLASTEKRKKKSKVNSERKENKISDNCTTSTSVVTKNARPSSKIREDTEKFKPKVNGNLVTDRSSDRTTSTTSDDSRKQKHVGMGNDNVGNEPLTDELKDFALTAVQILLQEGDLCEKIYEIGKIIVEKILKLISGLANRGFNNIVQENGK